VAAVRQSLTPAAVPAKKRISPKLHRRLLVARTVVAIVTLLLKNHAVVKEEIAAL